MRPSSWLLAISMVVASITMNATANTCNLGASCVFTNVADFQNQTFEHLRFDPVDERTPADIVNKFANIASFTMTGGSVGIRHTSDHAAVTSEGLAGGSGGPVSGEWRIDWGYFDNSEVVITFRTPIDAVGGFFGGDISYATLHVVREDGTLQSVSRNDAGLPGVGDGNSSCQAINGFLGVDSNGGSKITQVKFTASRDASSLDSIFFGNAEGGANGPGPTLFAESPLTDCPNLPPPFPEPAATLPIADAGEDQVVVIPTTVTLNGSGSRASSSSSSLAMNWVMTDKPATSQTMLSNPTSLNPVFVPDVVGVYVVELTVVDASTGVTVSDTVTITALDRMPPCLPGPPCVFTNVLDFGGQSFDHISFDTDDERTPSAIVNKFSNIASFTMNGGSVGIRHTSDYGSTAHSEGLEGGSGGPVSGEWRVDWGYFEESEVVITFRTPVDAVGGFFGGDYAYAAATVVYENGTTATVSREQAGLPKVNNGSSSCEAINGFLGIDSNGGPKISQVRFTETRDASSLDSIFFGTADAGAQGPGPTLFAESPLTNCPKLPPTLPSPVNQPPIAEAGPDQNMHVGVPVSLDGSGSTDPEGNYPLDYTWTVVKKPASSVAVMDAEKAKTVNPTFTPDVMGDYDIQLIVDDSLNARSQPDTMKIGALNVAPVADAGPDQAITLINSTVTLDGTQSYDEDGDEFNFKWIVKIQPPNSDVTLEGDTTPNPTFTPRVYGEYQIELVVTDEHQLASESDLITVSFVNVPPVADAGNNQSVYVGQKVTLDGSASTDANGDSLGYAWSVKSQPADSVASIPAEEVHAAKASLIPDKSGTFTIELVVDDGAGGSSTAAVNVFVRTIQSDVIQNLNELITLVNSLNDSLLKNSNMKNALTNKINSVSEMVDAGRYQDALNMLRDDIQEKTDGCPERGTVDKNDWIQVCQEQYPLWNKINEAIARLSSVI